MTKKLLFLVAATMVLVGCAEMQALLEELGLPARENLPSVAPGVVLVAERDTAIGHLVKHRYDVSESGRPLSTTHGFPFGPASWENTYSQVPQFPVVMLPGGEWAVLWRDTESGSLFLTRFGEGHLYQTVGLPASHGLLLGACADPHGNIYYLTAEANTDPRVELIKVDREGALLARSALPYGQDAFDIHLFERDVANLDFGNGMLGVVMGRTMQKSDDGLNHQGSIAATFRASDLGLVRIHGQNSGHSFDNKLFFDGESFVSVDLGDNYPRGIVVHRFLEERSRRGVVFTYKTQHGEEKHPHRNDQRGRPLKAGRWSNDNKTYTELGGIRSGIRGYVVLFSSEKSTDNRRTKGFLNEPRNLGFVLVSPAFDTAKQEDLVVTSDIVISQGESSKEFQFYTFDGQLVRQRREGVVWLTDYRDAGKENVSRPKLEHLGGGVSLALWEKWTPSYYVSTYALVFDESGGVRGGEVVDLGDSFRLQRGDEIVRFDDSIVWLTSNGGGLEVNQLTIDPDIR